MRTISVLWIGALVAAAALRAASGVQILSKSKLEKCEKTSDSGADLNCTKKIVLNLAVPSGSSGGEASIVAELVEVEENPTQTMQTLRVPPVLTINKSAAYAVFELTYIRDVAYKPVEYWVVTRKCEPDASAKIVRECERLRDEQGHIMEHTEPICCPCGTQQRMPWPCPGSFSRVTKGKGNTAYCVRFPGDWFHVFSIGQRSVGFSVKIEVKTGSKVSEVFVGPENRTATSNDNFLRVNLVGDFVGYTSIPSFEDFFLVIPRQGGPGQPPNLGGNFSMWMLLERPRFTLDGLECNKIGISYQGFSGQPDFCHSPFMSCLHNQLWNFWEDDQNRIKRNQKPMYGVEGRFERINQHPNAGTHSFSIGVTEVLNSNLLIELRADDIDYVYQRSPGNITSINIPTFEALSQSGVATITTKNTGEVEASYGLTFDCTRDVSIMEEQFFIMKPKEEITRSFEIYPGTNQASKYVCAAILKDSDYNEVDRAECQFSTTSTVLDNGTQNIPSNPPKHGVNFETVAASIWREFWTGLADFITGKTCRTKCHGFFDFKCHIQYICVSWILMFGLFLAMFPTVMVLLWLLHQKGLFDPVYDWWDDHCWTDDHRNRTVQRHRTHIHHHHRHHNNVYHNMHQKQNTAHHNHVTHRQRRTVHEDHLHHFQKQKNKLVQIPTTSTSKHFGNGDLVAHKKRGNEKGIEIR